MFRSQRSDTEYVSIALSDASTSKLVSDRNSQFDASQPPRSVAESKWGIGWRTLTSIIFFYVLALVIAIAHLVMYLKLDGRLTHGDGLPSQTYIASVSTFFVNAFGASLVVALGFAFTQCLWRLYRTQPMTVRNVETLYCLRWSPSLLLDWTAWAAAPFMCLLASTMLFLAIARIFPPGALTIVPRDLVNSTNRAVPTFKSDFVGNTSRVDSAAHLFGSYTVTTSIWRYVAPHSILRRIAYAALSTGEVLPSQSPCGPNCTYHIVFEGPYFKCENFTDIISEPNYASFEGYPIYKYFSAGYVPDTRANPPPRLVSDNAEDAQKSIVAFPDFTMNLTSPIGKDSDDTLNLVSKTHHLKCQSAAVTYELDVKFRNGIRSLSHSVRDDVRLLSSLYTPYVVPPGLFNETYAANEWSKKELGNFRVMNLFSLTDSVAKAIGGIYPMVSSFDSSNKTEESIELTNGTKLNYRPSNKQFRLNYYGILEPNGTIAANTFFNKNRDKFDELSAEPDFEISAELLNDALVNVTISALHAFQWWNTTANVTMSTSRNFYSFSNPLNFYVPYGVALLVVLPFLIWGIIALRQNGVSAMEGSFLQAVMTTTASQRLNEAAAAGCLGGEGNIPGHLKERRILFGELLGYGQGELVRRAGFGFEDEVVPLRKGARYGAEVK
ncbi:hypothetical protein CEP51_001511 [Fusarium floridanum]|uniref:Uncharacterized protein n=1 Tax=Fusarium floridanum TaxID=1325733 RepID=A0A428SGI6_9HYPO|nr:hypothetical protein CEP51_001511 [Fusarium floridanum]